MVQKYKKGRNFEYKALQALINEDYKGARTAGSHSAFDIAPWRKGEVILVQVKPEKQTRMKDIQGFLKEYYCERGEIRRELWLYKEGGGFERIYTYRKLP